LGFQALAFCDFWRHRGLFRTTEGFVQFRVAVLCLFVVALAGACVLLYPSGYFGPLSSRIRGLFVKHTRTGNPLVDSVAEHQPASRGIYRSYLHLPLDYAMLGGLVSCWNRNNAFYFMLLYAVVAHHFSGKMSRLILVCAPITSVGCGILCGFLLDRLLEPFLLLLGKKGYVPPDPGYKDSEVPVEVEKLAKAVKGKKSKTNVKQAKAEEVKPEEVPLKRRKLKHALNEWDVELRPGGCGEWKRRLKDTYFEDVPDECVEQYEAIRTFVDHNTCALVGRAGLSLCLFLALRSVLSTSVANFLSHCDKVAHTLSNPQVVFERQDQVTGERVVIDDYLQGYRWIEKNTPQDSRVMAWWDYGYQITGIGKRTSLADGNTWNHEHIAMLGKTLTCPEEEAWGTIRHLADYVLVWAGGGGDDLAKSLHLARIGNSVYPDHCGDHDPKCSQFGFDADRNPTPMMEESLLYKLVVNGVTDGVAIDRELFEEVHSSEHGLLRIYKVLNVSEESKAWVADPANRVCDAPGSWYCVGQYPPAIRELIDRRRNFAQLEDFNRGGRKSAYSKLVEKETEKPEF